MSKKKSPAWVNEICWNELVTSNEKGAIKFYTNLLGWKTKPFGQGIPYTLFTQGKKHIGGVMQCPKPGNPPIWIPYVAVKNVDATIKKTVKLGGKIAVPAKEIPTIGRIAVMIDPQGAAFGIFTPKTQD